MSHKQHDLILISLQFRKVISVHYVALQLDLATLYSSTPVNREVSFIWIVVFNSATQGRLFGSGKTAAKVLKNRREGLGNNTLNEPVPRHIQMLVGFFVPNQRPESIGLLSWSHLCSRCTSLARAGLRAFYEQSFHRRPQSLLYQFHLILLYHWGENFNKFTNFKGRKNSPARA